MTSNLATIGVQIVIIATGLAFIASGVAGFFEDRRKEPLSMQILGIWFCFAFVAAGVGSVIFGLLQ